MHSASTAMAASGAVCAGSNPAGGAGHSSLSNIWPNGLRSACRAVTCGDASKIRNARPIRVPKWLSGQEHAGQPRQGTLQTRPCAHAGVITRIPNVRTGGTRDTGARPACFRLCMPPLARLPACTFAAIATPGLDRHRIDERVRELRVLADYWADIIQRAIMVIGRSRRSCVPGLTTRQEISPAPGPNLDDRACGVAQPCDQPAAEANPGDQIARHQRSASRCVTGARSEWNAQHRRSVADADSDPNPAVPRRTDRSGVGDRLAGVERAVLFCRIQASVGSRARSHDTDGRLWCANGATVEDVAHPLWRPVGV